MAFGRLFTVSVMLLVSLNWTDAGTGSFAFDLQVGNSTIITSTYFPDNYRNNERIVYVTTAPEGYNVRATFHNFSTEEGRDYLTIRSGSDEVEPGTVQLARLSGSELPDEITSPGRSLWMAFESDVSSTYSGYMIELSAVEHEACTGDQFQCASGLCIADEKVCDVYNDCLDFSDEDYCPRCSDIAFQGCKEALPYSYTVFPNIQAEDATEAADFFTNLNAATSVSSCHIRLVPLLCTVFYPDCPHSSGDLGLCRNECLDVTASCRDAYETTFGRQWPLNCDEYTNWVLNGEGQCLRSIADPFSTNICGTRPGYQPDQSRVLGGVNALRGEVPWMASIRLVNDTQSICGASLIGSEWAVTAARCLSGYVGNVVLGDLYLSTPSEHHISIAPRDIYIYPQYNSSIAPGHGDLALIRLSEPVTYNDYVRPVCLPDTPNAETTYRRCHIAGWGATREDDVDGTDALQRANVQILDPDFCNNTYFNALTDLMMCAGYEQIGQIDSCFGDGGGPLVCQATDERWYLVGIAVSGIGCGRPGYPGVYAVVSQFRSFIDSVVNTDDEGHSYNLTDSSTVVLDSPNYPNNYPHNAHITYRINAPENYRVRADVTDLSLGDVHDYLSFGNGERAVSQTEIARFSTSSGITPSVTSSGRTMWIKFQSDFSTTDRGFRLELSAVPDNGESNDILLSEGQTVIVSSPNYPNNYNNSLYQLWRVTAPEGHSVSAHFNDFVLESEDVVRVGFGASPIKSATDLTGDEVPEDITSPGRYMWTIFETGPSDGARGFQVEFTAERTEDIDECISNPCINGGSCTDNLGFYQCSCPGGFKGDTCNIDLDDCFNNPCQNGATCVNGTNMFLCQCAPGFTGPTCTEVLAGPCYRSPCMNGATCVSSGENDYTCECGVGYVGDRCQIDVNECSSLPCQNGGRCVDEPGTYTCLCRLGYSGNNCEKVGYCDIEGEWYNEWNDKLILSHTPTGMLLGDYMKSGGNLDNAVPDVIVGYANRNYETPSFGLVMSQNNGQSSTSWTGQCHLCAGMEVLYTTWARAKQMGTCADQKRATNVGQDRWTRYRQSPAPLELGGASGEPVGD